MKLLLGFGAKSVSIVVFVVDFDCGHILFKANPTGRLRTTGLVWKLDFAPRAICNVDAPDDTIFTVNQQMTLQYLSFVNGAGRTVSLDSW